MSRKHIYTSEKGDMFILKEQCPYADDMRLMQLVLAVKNVTIVRILLGTKDGNSVADMQEVCSFMFMQAITIFTSEVNRGK